MKLLETLRAREERRFWALALWLLAIFLMGGGSRDDIASLIVLRPLSASMLAIAAYQVTAHDLRQYRSLLAILGAIVALVALHLVPLPPALWKALPQGELISEIDRAADIGAPWRPLSIAPSRTWNALFSLMVPVSVVLFAIRLDAKQITRTVSVVLAIGLLSVILGAFQVVGGADALYFYAIHNPGAADGLFANRNHQGAFLACLPPLLAVFASNRRLADDQRRFRVTTAGVAALTLVPVLLVTGSRAGLALGLLGFAASALVYHRADFAPPFGKRPRNVGGIFANKRLVYGGFATAAVALAAVTVSLSRAESLRRLLASGETEELRLAALGQVTRLALDYLPLGSGAGTFVEAFFRIEPRSFLAPTYLNHAHFDYLEWVVTGGIPALSIIGVAIGFASIAAFRLFLRATLADPGVQLGRAGLIVLTIFAAASIVDYPLRTPAISAFAALAAVWVWRACTGLNMSRATG